MAKENEEKEIQTVGDGAGPRYHRVYSIDLPVSFESAQSTMANLKLDPTAFSPEWIAVFEKTKGGSSELQVGDEFLVRISGPWNGPVRVSQVTDASFTLLTLDGHLEAGQIQFSLHSKDNGQARFEIESITRSKDRMVDFFYDKLRLAQFAQSEMWELFCKNFAERSLGVPKTNGVTGAAVALPPVVIKTSRQDEKTGLWVDVSDQIGAHGLDSK